jgi:hypothetical protein
MMANDTEGVLVALSIPGTHNGNSPPVTKQGEALSGETLSILFGP